MQRRGSSPPTGGLVNTANSSPRALTSCRLRAGAFPCFRLNARNLARAEPWWLSVTLSWLLLEAAETVDERLGAATRGVMFFPHAVDECECVSELCMHGFRRISNDIEPAATFGSFGSKARNDHVSAGL